MRKLISTALLFCGCYVFSKNMSEDLKKLDYRVGVAVQSTRATLWPSYRWANMQRTPCYFLMIYCGAGFSTGTWSSCSSKIWTHGWFTDSPEELFFSLAYLLVQAIFLSLIQKHFSRFFFSDMNTESTYVAKSFPCLQLKWWNWM